MPIIICASQPQPPRQLLIQYIFRTNQQGVLNTVLSKPFFVIFPQVVNNYLIGISNGSIFRYDFQEDKLISKVIPNIKDEILFGHLIILENKIYVTMANGYIYIFDLDLNLQSMIKHEIGIISPVVAYEHNTRRLSFIDMRDSIVEIDLQQALRKSNSAKNTVEHRVLNSHMIREYLPSKIGTCTLPSLAPLVHNNNLCYGSTVGTIRLINLETFALRSIKIDYNRDAHIKHWGTLGNGRLFAVSDNTIVIFGDKYQIVKKFPISPPEQVISFGNKIYVTSENRIFVFSQEKLLREKIVEFPIKSIYKQKGLLFVIGYGGQIVLFAQHKKYECSIPISPHYQCGFLESKKKIYLLVTDQDGEFHLFRTSLVDFPI